MIKRETTIKAMLALLALVVLAFVGLGFRLVDLQVWRHDELSWQGGAKKRTGGRPKRGDILDANGNCSRRASR